MARWRTGPAHRLNKIAYVIFEHGVAWIGAEPLQIVLATGNEFFVWDVRSGQLLHEVVEQSHLIAKVYGPHAHLKIFLSLSRICMPSVEAGTKENHRTAVNKLWR